MRSELERETGSWPVSAATTWGTASAEAHSSGQDGSVVDLDKLRRKRAGDDAATGRRLPRPRRVGDSGSDRSRDDGPDSPPAETRAGRHRK
jgi:hypothetical protein